MAILYFILLLSLVSVVWPQRHARRFRYERMDAELAALRRALDEAESVPRAE